MIQEYQIRILPEQAASEEGIKRYLAKEKGLDVRTLNQVRVLKRSIDARQRTIFVNLKVRAYINEFPQDNQYVHTEYPDVSSRPRVIVVGEGPGGLFASLRLIELGYRPIVLERGKDVRERKKDLSNITKTQKVDGESNYCFGEGGAGAYSDGKLYTRSKKRGSVDKILNVFCQHGANTNILADAHPHIGTDKLPRVIENMRNTIIKCGGEVHFQTKMIRLILESEGKLTAPDAAAGDRVIGVEAVNLATGAEETYRGPVILATGHSARDVYRYLASAKIDIEAKGIAVGVRLEHPSQLIDQIQYHNKNGRGKYLPAAEYSFVTQVDGRGVYSFCMCPGGFVIPAATGPEQLVVNGMSPSNRGTAWSNSGMVVETHPEDVAQFVKEHQAVIEQQEMKAQENSSHFTPHSSLFTLHFPGKRQCYPGIDSQKDYKQGLHGVYDENEEEGIVCLNAIEYEHCLDGKMPRSGSIRSWYDDRYAAHDECHQTAHQIEMGGCFEALEGEIVVEEITQPDTQCKGDVERYISDTFQRDDTLPESSQCCFHLIIYSESLEQIVSKDEYCYATDSCHYVTCGCKLTE